MSLTKRKCCMTYENEQHQPECTKFTLGAVKNETPDTTRWQCNMCRDLFYLVRGVLPEHPAQGKLVRCPGSSKAPMEVPNYWEVGQSPSWKLHTAERLQKGDRVMIGGGGDVVVEGNHIERETHPTGAIREVKEERYDLIPTEPIRLLAVHYGRGAQKYEERNWEKGLPWSNMFNSARRHMDAWLNGQDIDPDPIMRAHHLVAAIWNLVGLVEFATTHPELDDRKKRD